SRAKQTFSFSSCHPSSTSQEIAPQRRRLGARPLWPGCGLRQGRQFGRTEVVENALRPPHDKVDSLIVPEPLGNDVARLRHARSALLNIMSVRRQQMTKPLVEHSLGPIAWPPPKSAHHRPRGDLHEHRTRYQPPDQVVVALHP